MKNYVISGMVALVISLGVVWLAPDLVVRDDAVKIEHINTTPVAGAVYTLDEDNEIVPLDFTSIADKVKNAVVHIKSVKQASYSTGGPQYRTLPDPFRDFFRDDFFDQFMNPGNGYRQKQQKPNLQVGTGSGVIINSEGYIVTNNHVIRDAEDIEVTLHDNRSFKATVIGVDPSTDLALIQINESDLPTVPLVNSDDVRVGEWVLAVGNPFNLNSTVTAGIISAKSRNINILQDQYAVESFIQTDAAINPGNSGGALVNLQGGLVGINTAIASPTGSYTGYGFAVPANIVNKVVEDLLKYGVVQRGYLGVTIRGVDANLVREKELEVSKGVFVDSLLENGAAIEGGIEAGDVILKVDDTDVNTAPELQEMVARHGPGDEVKLSISRGGKIFDVKVMLKNRDGEAKYLADSKHDVFNVLGAEFEDIDRKTAKELDIAGGVRVKKLYAGKLSRHTEMKEGFIITKVDKTPIRNTEQLAAALSSKDGGVLIEGIYENLPGSYFYAFGL